MDPNIVIGPQKDAPINRTETITAYEGKPPASESENFRKVAEVWGKTQERIEGEEGKDLDGNQVVPSLYQEFIFAQNTRDPQRMLVMNAGHIQRPERAKDEYGNDATDAFKNPLYIVQVRLPTILSDGTLGYVCLQLAVPHNDTRQLEQFMHDEVPRAWMEKMKKTYSVISKNTTDGMILFKTDPEKNGQINPQNFTGFSFLPLGPNSKAEWSGIAKPARQLFEAAVNRNVAAKEAEREAQNARIQAEEAARAAAELAAAEALQMNALSEDDL